MPIPEKSDCKIPIPETYPLLNPDADSELRKSVCVTKTDIQSTLGSGVFKKFSTWDSLIGGLSLLRSTVRRKLGLDELNPSTLYLMTELFVIKIVQTEVYDQDVRKLLDRKPIAKDSHLYSLDPYLDNEGVIHVGGRIKTEDKSGANGPIVVPRKSHIAHLLLMQGRHIMEGAVRSAGYWVIGAKRLISSILNSCVTCRKLRRKLETQKMRDLPNFRCRQSAPFTYVGVDTFGPWEVLARRTRGGVANSKRWAILFTCLTCRAIHIELVEEMTSAAFINALRWFVAVRGRVVEFHSDRGTNFVGSTEALMINTVNVESTPVKMFIVENGCTWIFNPPHASHMGGVWERTIGTARRILNAIIMQSKKLLSHDVLNTFMSEVCAIVNSRPLANVSVDPTQPSVLSHSVLLTQKTELEVGPFRALEFKDMYKTSWQHIQILANQFWKWWQQEYLHSLQSRRKWVEPKENIKVNDVVLLKDIDCVRYEWPMAVVLRTFPSKDGRIINVKQQSHKKVELTDEGRQVADRGSHEALIFNAVPVEGILQSELMKTVPNAKIGFSKAMQLGWVRMDKGAEGGPRVFRKVDSIEDCVQQCLLKIASMDLDDLPNSQRAEYKKRKLITEFQVTSYFISKGPEFTLSIVKPETELTAEMLTTGSWKEKTFKPLNFDALGIMPPSGHLHPLLKVRAEFRQIFLEMGFTEMPTNNYIESSFWNFDALFQPQQHPARDAHDTFFVSEPQHAHEFPMEYLERVKEVHSEGGYGSQGYRYDWKIEEAKTNLLRTHTTAVTARMLYKLAQEKVFRPVKYFSIDRVFRNETLDATHLAEFNQIEGVVADYGLTLGDLKGVIQEFFHKADIKRLRFKPAYNPYTEPSMEIFGYHEGLKKWVEIGNSGLFRPEMLLPMGLPEGVAVLGWGLSCERPTMIKYKIDNIRELIGTKVNLQMVYDNPLCRLDK
ncbi:hypothetical protein ScPMuIL_005316 [Solemya velum]